MKPYEYPQTLVDHITEMESEGLEVFISTGFDSTVFMVLQRGTGQPWVQYIEWCAGDDKWQLVNITGKAFDRLKRVMKEAEDDEDEQ